jgi:hypothetical protein
MEIAYEKPLEEPLESRINMDGDDAGNGNCPKCENVYGTEGHLRLKCPVCEIYARCETCFKRRKFYCGY